MLKPKVQYSLQNAKTYFKEHLEVGDYYSEGHTIKGEWFGKGAEQLGLAGTVSEKHFLALCDGNHPVTGEWLTQRKNTIRSEGVKDTPNRRVFYDFTLGPPKSVSLVALYRDPRIVELHEEAVRRAMHELERYAQSRVRKNDQNTDRVTGNIIGAAFKHETSRELDPHLHTHCIVFNATRDPEEKRWKALQAKEMYRAQKFVENYYFHELAKGLKRFGYGIENNEKNFEIAGVSQELRDVFSKRHHQIDEETQKRIEQEGLKGNIHALREQVAYGRRRRKIRNSTASFLRSNWHSQMTVEQREKLNHLTRFQPYEERNEHVSKVINWTKEHLFERKSVVAEHQFLSTALEYARGRNIDLAGLRKGMENANLEREVDGYRITSCVVLDRELAVVLAAKDGRNKYRPYNPIHEPAIKTISEEQSKALHHILSSRDFITLFRGKAGVGKSFVLKEVQRGLEYSGHHVIFLAPQRGQVREFQKDGVEAMTVAHFLTAKEMPVNAVVVVDEAGQVGGKQMYDLVSIVQEREGRIILSGDTGQHGAVTASDTLRAIEKYSLLEAAELKEVHRQNPALGQNEFEKQFIQGYKEAVQKASESKIIESYQQLEKLGCIQEVDMAERRQRLVQDYLGSLERKESVLIVSQTWDEIHGINEAVREALMKRKLIGEGRELKVYQSRAMSEAQKMDPRYYKEGDHVYLIKRYGRYRKGEICPVVGVNEKGVTLEKNGRCSTISHKYGDRLSVVRERTIEVSSGDRLQLKFNGRSMEGKSIVNGELVNVVRLRKNGSLVVQDDTDQRKTLSSAQRLFNLGYAVTSYSSQGKTVDRVLFMDSANRIATNEKQYYVSISRARKGITLYTSNKEELKENIRQTGERVLAMELETRAKAARMERERWLPKIYHGLSAVQQQILLNIQNLIHREIMEETMSDTGYAERATVEPQTQVIEYMGTDNPGQHHHQPSIHEHHIGMDL